MELGDLLGVVGFIILFTIGSLSHVAFIGLIIFLSFYPRYSKKKQLQVWQKLASEHGLTYHPGGTFDMPRVSGYYKGYPLKLETFWTGNRNGKINSRAIILLTDDPPFRESRVKVEDILNVSLTEPEIIHLFQSTSLNGRAGESIIAASQGWQIIYTQEGLATDLNRLPLIFDWLIQMIELYPAIVALGGEVVARLQNIGESQQLVRPLIMRLLYDIGQETANRLRAQADHLFCTYCLTCCGDHRVDLAWWQSVSFYGCRSCGQSRSFYEGKIIVAILDNQTSTELFQQHGALYVNWSIRRELFDFSEVKIAQASDEEVERFAVQVGNDTDPARQDRYQRMRCTIAPDCPISANSLKILQRTFGQVVVEEGVNN